MSAAQSWMSVTVINSNLCLWWYGC